MLPYAIVTDPSSQVYSSCAPLFAINELAMLMGVLELISDQICPGTINSKLVDVLDIKL